MTTARDLINLAAKEAGILGVGQTLLAEDINDCFTLLTRMLAQWQKRRWLVPGLTQVSAIGNGLKSNKIGPGQYYNAIRPDKILAAYFLQTNATGTPVSYQLTPIFSYEDYVRVTLKELVSFPGWFFYDGDYPYGNVYIWPIPSNQYEIHLITKLPIGFSTSIVNGVLSFSGVGLTDGNYVAVPLIGGSENANGANANITVAAGIVTNFTINNGGNGYRLNDNLTVSIADIGGIGFAPIFNITGTSSSLDSDFNMPEEYEEAIHYNLALRICSAYGEQPTQSTGGLAKVALNTIKNANAQVPTLVMPRGYSTNDGYGFNIYAPDVYQ
jgi:hypothetical protein